MAATSPYGRDGLTNGEITVSGDEHITTVLNALNDSDCRTILEELRNTEEYLSASELSERCDVPLSTTYRKVELLTEASLVEEQLRIRRSGKHTSEYGHSIDDVKISVTPDAGVELELSHCLSA